ncbi:hypothetical protein RFI_15299 [Reticulomyxa filosa]|uniref:Uncharacterized protein n=1 Tax=Reticulomyxa filosa TaxID=46433 RepID=X6N7P1_RETFI|nr:hypothetical protein RFI_15299 [Reticulomyxa filosa]|eukprot:ETO21903.1 hypothetical protein RFI_15299 [Reticulomyxa filosa]
MLIVVDNNNNNNKYIYIFVCFYLFIINYLHIFMHRPAVTVNYLYCRRLDYAAFGEAIFLHVLRRNETLLNIANGHFWCFTGIPNVVMHLMSHVLTFSTSAQLSLRESHLRQKLNQVDAAFPLYSDHDVPVISLVVNYFLFSL